ncbi:MAG: tRNA guanosine(34) transglycosylase Tgt [Defluviitaleaceae bacterium]|nr:tRNA guanosine(34) transglycosylase Tgt [Defluviitaleaceae bacterium]
MKKYTVINTEGNAKTATLETVHGTIETPVFMNVATAAAIKGGLDAKDLEDSKCQVALANTYHLHLRPGDETVAHFGGVANFMGWSKPTLTDSGGFQVFSLAKLRRIKEEGVYFASHIDGRKIFMGPEESMAIQSNLASTIAMAFDECPPAKAEKEYIQASVDRTTRWLKRSIDAIDALNAKPTTLNPHQLLFGINQGGINPNIRIEHAKTITDFDMAGYAIGGLAVGESHEEMYNVLDATIPHLPKDKPTYLMGVGTPENILEAVERGIDFFDCVLPARNGRHGHVFTAFGKLNLFNAKFERDDAPIDPACGCLVCKSHTRGYIRHLLKAKEMLGMRLCVMHNLYFYNNMMGEIREAIKSGNFANYKKQKLEDFKGD